MSARLAWIPWVLAIVAAAALAFAVGRFTMYSATGVPTPDAVDIGFARDMQVHHEQAVQMAMIEYRRAQDDVVRSLAYDIATTQAGQRGEMYDWLVQWGVPQSGRLMSWMSDSSGHDHGGASATEADLRAAMGMATDAQVDALSAASGTEADCLFLELMIRHHEGALPMAREAIDGASIPRVTQVAQTILTGQTAELDAMRSAQLRLGCTG